MQRYRECPSCRALLTQDQLTTTEGTCSYCDARVGEPGEYANPDAASDDLRRRRPLAPLTVPETLGGKLATAFFLLLEQFPIIAGLILLIKLPSNLGIGFLVEQNPNPVGPGEVFQLRWLVEIFFGPIYLAAVVTLLANRMSGRPTSFGEAARAGLHCWSRLFAARIVSGVFIALGLILLIVPGIILAVRYCFIDEMVVLEGSSVADSRARSSALASGRELKIFLAGFTSTALIVALTRVAAELAENAGILEDTVMSAIFISVVDVLGIFVTIVTFLYYWEARAEHEYAASTVPALKEIEGEEV